jgi:hypothetical protein
MQEEQDNDLLCKIFENRLVPLKKFQENLWELRQCDIAFDHSCDEHRNEIIRGHLWIGDAVTKGNSGFDAIVSLGDTEGIYVTYPGIAYHRIVAQDSNTADLLQHFDAACNFIHQHKRVLVHCQAGVSRSPTICIAYLMKYHGLFLEGAYMCVKGARRIICPNMAFMKQLIAYEALLLLPQNDICARRAQMSF